MQGLFNWIPTTDVNGNVVNVVNDKFWIYWAISVPLTIITLIGWGFWWRVEMERYPKDETEKEELKTPPGWIAQMMETLGWSKDEVFPPSQTEPRKSHSWVFGGVRRKSKLGVDGNPLSLSMNQLADTEAGTTQSPLELVSPKSQMSRRLPIT